MNDDELRSLIRVAIQKHMSAAAPGDAASAFARELPGELRRDGVFGPVPVTISFEQYRLERSAGDTECLIEPAVQCNHCGYCQSYGH